MSNTKTSAGLFPVLYSRRSDGGVQTWKIEVQQNKFRTVSGTQNGEQVTSSWTSCNGKNLKASNATTPEQQAVKEARAKWQKKVDSGYKTDLAEIDNIAHFEPMLAHKYPDYKDEIAFPVWTQPKLDGCLHGNVRVATEEGPISIRDIVERKLNVRVQSWNEKTKQVELRRITNWFNNGTAPQQEWLDITAANSRQLLKVTKNHKLLSRRGWIRADAIKADDEMLLAAGSSQMESLIVGSLLGDGTLVIDDRIPTRPFRIALSSSNKMFLAHKRDLMGASHLKIGKNTSGYGSKMFAVRPAVNGFEDLCDVFRFTTFGEPEYMSRRLLTANVLKKHVTDLALAIWYFDDGSLRSNNGNEQTPVMSISTHRYTDEQIEEFIKFFTARYQCTPTAIIDKRVRTKEQSGKLLNFNTKDTLYLLNILRQYGVDGMKYKLHFPVSRWLECDQTADFRPVKVKKCRRMSPSTKYDIEVEGNHNYFAAGKLVHNCRCIVRKDGMWSRNGKPILSAPHVAAALKPVFDADPLLVLDGELYADKLANDFNKIISLAKRSKPTAEELAESAAVLQYHIYDMWHPTGPGYKFSVRHAHLSREIANLASPMIVAVETHIAADQSVLDRLYAEWVASGYEGQMIRLDAPYEQKRSKHLLKRKEFIDEEFLLLGVTEGKGNRAGMAGRCHFRTKTGVDFESGIRGNQDFYRRLLLNKGALIGKPCTVRFQNLTPDGVPRFPVCIEVRDYE